MEVGRGSAAAGGHSARVDGHSSEAPGRCEEDEGDISEEVSGRECTSEVVIQSVLHV